MSAGQSYRKISSSGSFKEKSIGHGIFEKHSRKSFPIDKRT
jgi:hypothetical protein